ncbi:MAG: GNAT family N-acetyltransferase, partial [Planctomycetota bacterium]|nr:GNAT family N-acetyltransferase [Planctomycetota bacterium]
MPEIPQLVFEPITSHKSGVIERLLVESFAGMAADEVEQEKCRLKWRKADRETFENPETIGRCTFITTLNGKPIGVGSFDPRGAPEVGQIGINCILPAYRGRGFGKQQMEEILRRLTVLEIRKAVVTTGEHSFFEAAQQMYAACGFYETRRFRKYEQFQWQVIEYEK